MKYFLILFVLFAACTTSRKSVNQVKEEVNKSLFSARDSVGKMSVDSISTMTFSEWANATVDSNYDKVIEETVTEWGDSLIITTRVIKEKGQKKVTQSATTSKRDSTGKKVDQQAAVSQAQKQDSTAVTVSTQKDVKRASFLPWWIWLIVAGVGVLAWWKRNSILELFT